MSIEWDNATLEQIFSIMSLVTLVGWVILLFLPRGWWISRVVPALIVPCLVAAAYTVLLASGMLAGGMDGDFNSLAGVRALFSSDRALLAGWLHYLAFDLVVGTIVARQADEMGMNRILQAPFLFLTLMFGPAGFLAFQLVRGGATPFARQG